MRVWIVLLGAALSLSIFGHPNEHEIELVPVADTSLFEAFPDNNLGGVATLVVGANQQSKRGRALVKFDLSSIPTNAAIVEASLRFQIVSSGGAVPATVTLSLHRMLQPWIEGTQSAGNNGGPAAAGEPSWNRRAAPGTSWTAPGSAAGSDYVAAPSAEQTIKDEPDFAFELSTNMLADLNLWLNKPASNFGWIVISDGEATPQSARRLGAREDTNTTPVLALSYVLPPKDFRIEEVDKVAQYFILHLDLEANHAYSVQYKPALVPGPSNCMTAPEDIRDDLRKLAANSKVVALGETGLDHHRLPSKDPEAVNPDDDAYKRKQAALFEQHLEVAAALKLNCVIHERDAFEPTLAQLEPWSSKVRGVFHCFVGVPANRARIQALGSMVSFTGICTFKNAQVVRDSIASAPLAEFMLETDCPYLAPVPFRGKRCEPAYVRQIAELVANVKGCSLEELSAATCDAAHRFFPRLVA